MNSVKTLILGLGNDILSDDRIGPDLVYDPLGGNLNCGAEAGSFTIGPCFRPGWDS